MIHQRHLAIAVLVGASLVGCSSTEGVSSFASKELKDAYASAKQANDAAKAAGFEWYWNNKSASKHIEDALKVANEKNDEKKAIEILQKVELAAKQGLLQAEAAKTAGPRFTQASAKAAPAAKTAAGSGNGQKTYQAACAACHNSGAAGAPKLGDKAAWASRVGTGLAALYTSALKGKGAMPAKGGNASLADADVKAAVDYMVAQAK
ncbi:MAG: c-type cytochrome [Thiothrix sp.]